MGQSVPWLVGIVLICATAGLAAGEVRLSAETRATAHGDEIPYLLFVPDHDVVAAPPPFPALIFTHGFARDYGRHIGKGARYAGEGLIVLMPSLHRDDSSFMSRWRNVANTVDHFRWLVARSSDPNDPLFGLIDAQRIALAGHSAGAAISLEAARALQRAGAHVAALVLLDGVPYPSTTRAATRLQELPVLSLRSEPSACNAFGAVENIVDALIFGISDIQILGATHCAPEGPTDVACELLCGASTPQAHESYETLPIAFLSQVLGTGNMATPFPTLTEELLSRDIIAPPSP
jgi:pimeloyl-ACP methyl ester carboxylesterase